MPRTEEPAEQTTNEPDTPAPPDPGTFPHAGTYTIAPGINVRLAPSDRGRISEQLRQGLSERFVKELLRYPDSEEYEVTVIDAAGASIEIGWIRPDPGGSPYFSETPRGWWAMILPETREAEQADINAFPRAHICGDLYEALRDMVEWETGRGRLAVRVEFNPSWLEELLRWESGDVEVPIEVEYDESNDTHYVRAGPAPGLDGVIYVGAVFSEGSEWFNKIVPDMAGVGPKPSYSSKEDALAHLIRAASRRDWSAEPPSE